MQDLSVLKIQIEERYKNYDSSVGLIQSETEPNYHSNLGKGVYHKTNENTNFAVDIFYAEAEQYYPVANSILRKIASLQRKEGDWRGLWSYFYEESLEEMHAPDWNYADFNAIPILCALKDHTEKLEEGMCEILKDAAINACYAIMKRDLTVIYTNPCVMDIYVTIICGELCGKPEFVEYGKAKLKKFYHNIMANRAFDEYNCTGYSLLIAELFSIMIKHIKDSEALEKVNELNFVMWEIMGKHFHFKTGEVAGPNFRRYVNFLTEAQKANIETATGTRLDLKEGVVARNSEYMFSPVCPKELLHYFNEHHSEEYSRLFTRGSNYPWFNQPNVDTLYMTEDFSLGSFSLMDCWNQRSLLNSYIGDREEKCCIRLRVLHNNYDFSSGAAATIQHKGAAVSVVNFHTNHGDTHVDLDPIVDATITASDLRVRFQIEANRTGITEKISSEKIANGYKLNILGTPVEFEFPLIKLSGEESYVEITRTETEIFVDAVLYSGEEKKINMKELEEICAVATISVGEGKVNIKKAEINEGFINTEADINGKKAEIKALCYADEQIHSTMATKLSLDGERFEKFAEK